MGTSTRLNLHNGPSLVDSVENLEEKQAKTSDAEKVRDALEGGAPLADAKELMRSLKETILAAQTPTPDSSRPDAS